MVTGDGATADSTSRPGSATRTSPANDAGEVRVAGDRNVTDRTFVEAVEGVRSAPVALDSLICEWVWPKSPTQP